MELTYLKTFYEHRKDMPTLELHIEVDDDILLAYIEDRMRSKTECNDIYRLILDDISYSKENLSTFDCDGFRDFVNSVRNKDIRKAKELLYEFLSE